MTNSTFGKLQQTGKLPSPSGVGMRILKLTQGDDFSAAEIGQTIMADSALTGRLLKLANSVQAGSIQPIVTVSEAIMRLGIRTVRNVALGFSLISNNRTGTCTAFHYDEYWARSLGRAVTCQQLSRQVGVWVAAEAYILGLLSEIGYLAFASVFPDAYTELLEEHSLENPRELAKAERDRFGIDHSQLAVEMLQDWGLPKDFSAAVRKYENRDLSDPDKESIEDVIDVLVSSDLISRIFVATEKTRASEWTRFAAGVERIRTLTGMERDAFHAMCNRFGAEWREWGEVLAIPTEPVIDFGRLAQRAAEADAEVESEAGEKTARKHVAASLSEPATLSKEDRIRVLAVDDDPVSLKVVERALLRAGYEVVLARSGETALNQAIVQTPHLVVADWMMPGMDGIALCRSLRNTDFGKSIYFLLVTGHGDDQRVVEAFDAGVDDFIHKPFNPRILMARVKGGERIVRLSQQHENDQYLLRRQLAEKDVLTRKLQTAALTDTLTGLPNRRYAMRRMQQTWEAAVRSGQPLAFLMLDIDHFKRVNDEHGHDAGDAVLKETARKIREILREEEDVCRLGGEEFLIICPNTDPDGALACGERVRTSVEQNVISWGSFQRPVTVSIGAAVRDGDMEHFEDLLKAADEAVYVAKESGRNRVHLAGGPAVQRRSA